MAAAGALGAVAMAATLAIASAMAVFEQDVVEVLARPASVADDVSVQAFRDLATLPGPSPLVVAALLPAVVLLLLAMLLRRLGEGAPPLHGVSPEALGAAERTMSWAVRVIAAGALVVFVVPALLQLAGVRAVSLTTGSMAPAYSAGRPAPRRRAGRRRGDPGRRGDRRGRWGRARTSRTASSAWCATTTAVSSGTGPAATPSQATIPSPRRSPRVDGVVVAGAPVLGALRAWMASPLGIAIGLVLAWAFATGGGLLGGRSPARTRRAGRRLTRSRAQVRR